MPRRIQSLWREPLVHFLLIGFALFAYYDLANDNVEAPPKRIHVEHGQVQQLAANFQRTWSRPPTPEELDAMVESYVREEVLYREALAMGLDRDDPMVRRRLRMKLEFMLEDLSTQNVDDETLAAYLEENSENFRTEAEISFLQVYLDPDRRPQLETDVAQLLAQMNGGADPNRLGDPTLVQRTYKFARQSEIARDFGEEFAREVAAMPTGEWTGPVYSPFGAHLVKIDTRIDARLPALDEIRDRVLREYQARQRKMQKDLTYEKLREGYEITVEPLNSDTAGNLANAQAG